MRRSIVVAFVLFLCTASPLGAAPYYESFNYAAGEGIGGKTGGSGFAGPWVAPTTAQNTVQERGLGYNALETSGRSVRNDGGTALRDLLTSGQPIFGAPGNQEKIWISFLFKGIDTNNNLDDGFAGFSLFEQTGEQFGQPVLSERLFIGKAVSSTFLEPKLGLTVYDTPGAWGAVVQSSTFFDTTQTHFMVVKLEYNLIPDTTTISLFVDPELDQNEPPAPSASYTTAVGQQMMTFDWIRLASGGGSAMQFDEFRLGRSFAEVGPVVPEPHSATVLVVAASLLLRRRIRAEP